jgi:hypothetical protein
MIVSEREGRALFHTKKKLRTELLSSEDGGSMFFRNVDVYIKVHTTFLSRR